MTLGLLLTCAVFLYQIGTPPPVLFFSSLPFSCGGFTGSCAAPLLPSSPSPPAPLPGASSFELRGYTFFLPFSRSAAAQWFYRYRIWAASEGFRAVRGCAYILCLVSPFSIPRCRHCCRAPPLLLPTVFLFVGLGFRSVRRPASTCPAVSSTVCSPRLAGVIFHFWMSFSLFGSPPLCLAIWICFLFVSIASDFVHSPRSACFWLRFGSLGISICSMCCSTRRGRLGTCICWTCCANAHSWFSAHAFQALLVLLSALTDPLATCAQLCW